MPTAAKLAAALWFALLGGFVAELFRMQLGPQVVLNGIVLLAAGCGAVTGWGVLGRQAARGGVWRSVVFAIQTAVLGLGLALIVAATDAMLDRAWRQLYADPIDAVLGVFDLAAQFLLEMGRHPPVVGVLAGGTVAGGLFVHWVARRWR